MGTGISNLAVTGPMEELAALHQLSVKGADILEVQSPSENIVIKRPWIDEPSGSVSFDEQGGITLGVVGTGPQVVLTFIVPNGFDGVIKNLSNNVNFGGFVQFSGDLIWRLKQNGRPIKNYSNILAEKGTTQAPRIVSPIRIYSGDIITWEIEHVANPLLAGQIICSLGGYTYPSKGIS